MARSNGARGGGPSRIRFIMLDAEISEGDLGQVTQAIQNALRPVLPNQSTSRAAINQSLPNSGGTNVADEAAPIVVDDAQRDLSEQTAKPSRKRSPKKARSPKVIGVDLDTEPSFKDFAAAKNPPSDRMKFLSVAAWFKNARIVDAITADHVYTCYRKVGWSSGIDFYQPLYDLRKDDLLESRGNGEYAVNHIGLDKVDKLSS